MSAYIWLTGLEYGLPTPVTAGGGLFNTVAGAGISITGTSPISGSYSLRINCAATTMYVVRTITGTPGVFVARLKIRFDTLPTIATTDILTVRNAVSNVTSFKVIFDGSDNKIYFSHTDGDKTAKYGTALVAGQVYTIDLKINYSGTTWYGDAKVDGNAVTQYSYAYGSATTVSSLYIGGYTWASTYDLYYDDLGVSVTAGDYPLTHTGIEGKRPDQTNPGSSNPGTNNIYDNGGTLVNDSTNPPAVELDKDPFSATLGTYIKQTAGGAGDGHYAEVLFDDTDKTTILGAMALLQYQSSGTSANNGTAKIIDEDTTETNIFSGDMSESSMFYKSVMLPTPAGGWDQAAVNALKARVGFSTDINPVPYWTGLLIEVAYAEAGGDTFNEGITLSSGPACSPGGAVDFHPAMGALHSTPAASIQSQGDLVGAAALASSPALAPGSQADLLGSLALASGPAWTAVGGMAVEGEITLSSSPAAGVGQFLGIFPTVALSSGPTLSPAAQADLLGGITLSSAPAATLGALMNMLASLVLSSAPAWAAFGGSDFYEELTFSSGPALAAALAIEFNPGIVLASGPAWTAANIADLVGSMVLASNPAVVIDAGLIIPVEITFLSAPAWVTELAGMNYFADLSLESAPALAGSAQGDLAGGLILASAPAVTSAGLGNFFASLTLPADTIIVFAVPPAEPPGLRRGRFAADGRRTYQAEWRGKYTDGRRRDFKE